MVPRVKDNNSPWHATTDYLDFEEVAREAARESYKLQNLSFTAVIHVARKLTRYNKIKTNF